MTEPTTQEGLPTLATDDEIAELRKWAAHMNYGDVLSALARLEAAERQVKALRKDLTFVGDMAVYALKTDDDDDTSGILATIRDTSRAALEAKSHDD
jgi:hypothetical protein